MAPGHGRLTLALGSESAMTEVDFSKFSKPGNIVEAQTRVAIIASDIESINEQLEERVEPRPGQSDYDLSVWRRRAERARGIKQAETKWLQNWIAEERDSSGRPSFPGGIGASGLLLAVLPVLNVAAENGLVQGSNEAVLQAVRGFVANQFPSIGGLVTGTVTLEGTNVDAER